MRGRVAEEAARQPQELLSEGLLSAFRVGHSISDAVIHSAQPGRVGIPYPRRLHPCTSSSECTTNILLLDGYIQRLVCRQLRQVQFKAHRTWYWPLRHAARLTCKHIGNELESDHLDQQWPHDNGPHRDSGRLIGGNHFMTQYLLIAGCPAQVMSIPQVPGNLPGWERGAWQRSPGGCWLCGQ